MGRCLGRGTFSAILLNFFDVYCLRTSAGFLDVKGYRLSLLERLESVCLDTRIVYEDIGLAFDFDETITLFVIEPFYLSFCHLE